jgi:hypothetical protein
MKERLDAPHTVEALIAEDVRHEVHKMIAEGWGPTPRHPPPWTGGSRS